ncbi:MAG: hypothetical protein SGJ00_13530 [bacterium]|nr:hypothetical protein [bacterium]
MIKSKHFSFIILAGAALLVSSCSNQMYSYRQTVKVDQQTAKVQTPLAPIEIEATRAKAAQLPVAKMTAPAMVSVTAPANAPIEVSPKMEPVLKDIQTMVPQRSSKAAIAYAKKEVTSAKEQIKMLKKDVQKANSVGIDGRTWMVFGAILWVVATIIAWVLGGGLFWGIAAVGALIFVIGLIFFLLDSL